MSEFTQDARVAQAVLKAILQANKKDANKFENLTAALVGRLLEVPVFVAKSGFQHGGDAGTAGQSQRRLRIESKKYSETTSLSDRELLGEFDHAVARDSALESWILAATRGAPEQLVQDLTERGEREGVPVIVLDWPEIGIAPMAALCASAPDLVSELYSKEAGDAAARLAPHVVEPIKSVQRRLQSWSVGTESLRQQSHAKLQEIWTSPRSARAELAQDAAGGAGQRKTIRRAGVHTALNAWWTGRAIHDAPGVILGWDGVGKTWAALDWLVENANKQPIILAVPSSATSRLASATTTALKVFLAERLYELTEVRNVEHWVRRVEKLLQRPVSEGPIFTLYLDGLNQDPTTPWVQVLKVLQGGAFQGRVRVMLSTREHHFNDRLGRLNALVVGGELVRVDPYDLSADGELDQMLALEGLRRSDLQDDLIELARIPRLFALVMRLRERLRGAEQVTLHRLLWEYGRDTLGTRAERSFSEDEWRDWLREVATQHRNGIHEYSYRQIAEGAARPDLSEHEVYARMSDIIDGRFAVRDPVSGALKYLPAVVSHALGAALLAQLDAVGAAHYDTIENELTAWLDPIAGMDAKAEIIRAAVNIYVERGSDGADPIAAVLVTAWLQTQNVPDQHRQELVALAENLIGALIVAVERSSPHSQQSARNWSLTALKAAPRDDEKAKSLIFAAARRWLSTVSRELERPNSGDKEAETRRAARYIKRVGVDCSGALTVLGVPLIFEDRHTFALPSAAPIIMEGFPLEDAGPVFEAAAVAHSITRPDNAWTALKWIVLLNEKDRDETTRRLRKLSDSIARRTPEDGVHPELAARAGALLLWLTGENEDNVAARKLDPALDRHFDYQTDYLADPARSFFRIERRHAEEVLAAELPLLIRTRRIQDMWLDPEFVPPLTFVAEVRAQAGLVDPTKIHRHASGTIEDSNFQELEPVLARCAPDLLTSLTRQKLGERNLPPEARYWRAIQAVEHLLLVDKEAADAARALRELKGDQDLNHETYATTLLMALEGPHGSAFEKISAIIDAGLPYIDTDIRFAFPPPHPEDIDALVDKYGCASDLEIRNLVCLVSLHNTPLSDKVVDWLIKHTTKSNSEGAGVAFRILFRASPVRFGEALIARGWSWSHAQELWPNHFGSLALIQATLATPFEQIAPRLAPWLLLQAARIRGNAPEDVALASDIFGRAIMHNLEPPDPGSILVVDRIDRKSNPAQLSVRPILEDLSPQMSLRRAFDQEGMRQLRLRAVETAVERVKAARIAGASLYLADIDPKDFESVVTLFPERIEAWMAGAARCTEDFKRRVLLSEGVYLALCESLLAHNPPLGALLWRALRRVMHTKFIGEAGLDDMLHLVFRAPDSAPVDELRHELLSLAECNTDKELYELALAARINNHLAWLESAIDADTKDDRAWRRKRAIVFSGFLPAELPVAGAWPDREIENEHDHLEYQAAYRRWRDACARHWWSTFIDASDPETAYAAWILFLQTAGRRASLFMQPPRTATSPDNSFEARKVVHMELNIQRIKTSLAKFDDKLGKKFLDRDTSIGVGPWRR